VTTYCEENLGRHREIEFNAGSHFDTLRMAFVDFKRLANPTLLHFAQPYRERPQRLAS
jgi:prolyl-tRNA editing enzyme YbaK/EbsC (Cys-tRNA(Pro) deacylase)